MANEVLQIGQGPAKLVAELDDSGTPTNVIDREAYDKDVLGYTNPNLHRRIDPQQSNNDYEVAPRDYSLNIQNVDSYRTTSVNTHDDDSTVSEIP